MVSMDIFVTVNSGHAVLPTVFGVYPLTNSPLRECCLTESFD